MSLADLAGLYLSAVALVAVGWLLGRVDRTATRERKQAAREFLRGGHWD